MSDNDSDINSIDFGAEMRQLADTDMQQLAKQATAKGKHPVDKNELLLTLAQIIRPLAKEIETIKKTADDNTLLLVAMSKTMNSQQAIAAAVQHAQPPIAALDTIAQQMQRLGSVESANQKLFDALHAELKGYKDNFLFEALQKPFIRELLPLFDDLSSLHAQMDTRLNELREKDKLAAAQPPPSPRKTRLIDLTAALLSRHEPPEPLPPKTNDINEVDFLKNLVGNVENHVYHMVEILLRMDVLLVQTKRGLPLDKKVHRTISFEPAPTPEDDNTVARSLKPGFFWKERMLRPEDVIIYRWSSPGDIHQPQPVPQTVRPPVITPSI